MIILLINDNRMSCEMCAHMEGLLQTDCETPLSIGLTYPATSNLQVFAFGATTCEYSCFDLFLSIIFTEIPC